MPNSYMESIVKPSMMVPMLGAQTVQVKLVSLLHLISIQAKSYHHLPVQISEVF